MCIFTYNSDDCFSGVVWKQQVFASTLNLVWVTSWITNVFFSCQSFLGGMIISHIQRKDHQKKTFNINKTILTSLQIIQKHIMKDVLHPKLYWTKRIPTWSCRRCISLLGMCFQGVCSATLPTEKNSCKMERKFAAVDFRVQHLFWTRVIFLSQT